MDREEKKDYRRPGRGGFSQRRGYYGMAKGYNSKSFGNHTWTFYEQEQWDRFQIWMKEEKDRKKKEETKFLLKGVDELIRKRLGKRKQRRGKKDTPEDTSSSSEEEDRDSESEEEEPNSDQRKKGKYNKGKPRKTKQEWRKKNRGKEERIDKEPLPMKELIESLGRIESKMNLVEIRNRNLEREVMALKSREYETERELEPDIDSEAEKIQEVFRREDEEKERLKEDRWREIQSTYKGKDGTKKLKDWCAEREIPYKNKDNAMMAVMAANEER